MYILFLFLATVVVIATYYFSHAYCALLVVTVAVAIYNTVVATITLVVYTKYTV